MDTSTTAGTSAPSTSASAPAATTPSTPDAALDQAYAEVTSAAAPPTSETPTTPAGEAPTTAEPLSATPTPGPETKQGPIPFDVHQTALENARTKAVEKEQARLLEQWKQEIAPYQDDLKLAIRLRDDRAGALAELLEASKDDANVTALLARTLAGRRGLKTPGESDPEPPRFREVNGELFYDPAVDKAWREWSDRQIEQRLLGKIDEQYGPLKQSFAEQQKRAESQKAWAQYKTQADARAKSHAETVKALPFAKEHHGKIVARQQEVFAELQRKAQAGEIQLDPHEAPRQAYLQAYTEIVTQALPARDASLQAQTEQQFLQTAAQKSRGSHPDPAASAPAQPRTARTPDEALDQVFAAHRRRA